MVEPIIIKNKLLVNFALLAASLLFTGTFIYLLFFDHSNSSYRLQISIESHKPIFVIGLIFFGYCSLFFAKRFFLATPLLRVDETGITDNSTAIAVGHIPWEDIVDVKYAYYSQGFLAVKIKNEEEYLSRLNFIQRSACKANVKMGHSLVSIVLTTEDPKAILKEIEERFGHYYKKK